MKWLLLLIILFFTACSGSVENEADFQPAEDIIAEENNGFIEEITEKVIEEFNEDSGECSEPIIFEYPPVNLEKTKVLVPFGLMTGNHVTPIDHQYFQDFDNNEIDIEVYSPGDGTIKEIQHMYGSYEDKGKTIDWNDYRLVINHGCGIDSTYIHIDVLSDKIMEQAPAKGEYASLNIPVEAGEIIGWYKQNVDYNLVDQEHVLEGFVIPEHYKNEPWKLHVPDTLDYFTEDIQQQLIDLSLRDKEPYMGRYDHDIDGTLQGNWFLEGTNGYEGGKGDDRDGYWKGHLSISPNYLDYNHFIFSIGDYEGREEQFGIAINPSEINTNSGLVKIELFHYEYYLDGVSGHGGNMARGMTAKNVETYVIGTALIEMIEDRKLKLEIFPEKKSSEVDGFTDNYLVYER